MEWFVDSFCQINFYEGKFKKFLSVFVGYFLQWVLKKKSSEKYSTIEFGGTRNITIEPVMSSLRENIDWIFVYLPQHHSLILSLSFCDNRGHEILLLFIFSFHLPSLLLIHEKKLF
jgi:hypothetical protein